MKFCWAMYMRWGWKDLGWGLGYFENRSDCSTHGDVY